MAKLNERTDIITILQVQDIEGRPLPGMRVCVTGHLSKPRPEIFEFIQQAGGQVMESVSSATTHLVTNEEWNAGSTKTKVSSKYAKAQKLRVKIINEDQLIALVRKGDAEARAR